MVNRVLRDDPGKVCARNIRTESPSSMNALVNMV
jgi:hypothetical protein